MTSTCNFGECQSEAKSRCSRCKIVFYCCVEHQKSDWKVHKKICGVQVPALAPPAQSDPVCVPVLAPPTPSDPVCEPVAGTCDEAEKRQCRCMFCGEQLLLQSEESAVDHMRECPALQEQLAGSGPFTIPKAFQDLSQRESK